MLTVLIMAGGLGKRFWPLSNHKHPKQLLSLVSDKPMIFETVSRVLPIVNKDNIFIATNQSQSVLIHEALPMIPNENIIIEPAFKDTAAAIGYGATFIKQHHPKTTLVVLPSDHYVEDIKAFQDVIIKAAKLAQNGMMITLGVMPSYPETKYGYIKYNSDSQTDAYPVEQFIEKPPLDQAKRYVESHNYLWNAGMFIFTIDTLMAAFKKHSKKHFNLLSKIDQALKNANPQDINTLFNQFPKTSIDYAIMEKADNISVIPTNFGWQDVGDYKTLRTIYKKDDNGNIKSNTSLKTINAHQNIVLSSRQKNVSLIDVDGLVIVETDDDLLICKDTSTAKILDLLKQKEMDDNNV
jgi:mannose-1-phosphate guanylyltransferase